MHSRHDQIGIYFTGAAGLPLPHYVTIIGRLGPRLELFHVHVLHLLFGRLGTVILIVRWNWPAMGK